MAIYGAARTAPTPAANAIGTLMLVTSTIVIVVAVVAFRRMERARGSSGARPVG
jgi:ABC-type spermidine/putrescine transport system permease subunit II